MANSTGTEVLGVIVNPSHPTAVENAPNGFKSRGMVFTSFNMNAPPIFEESSMRYLVFGTEECPTTKRMHYQGFVYWNNPRSAAALAKRWKCWVRASKGTPEQARAYCIKDGNYKEFGILPRQGARTDLETLAHKLLEGTTTVDEICVKEPETFHQYGRTLSRLEDIRLRQAKRTEMTTCTWYVASTGKGKSKKAMEDIDGKDYYVVPQDNGWWDEYRQQEVVVFDDFRGSHMEYSQMLRLIDWTPFATVKRRNRGAIPFTSKHVIVTSSMTPEECYHNLHSADKVDQLLRRVNVVHLD